MLKKRVVIAVGTYPPAHGGGALRAHRTYRRVMELMPIDVTVVTVSGRGQAEGRGSFEGVEVIRTVPRSTLGAQFLTLGRQVFLRERRSIDLVHGMGMTNVVTAACAWAQLLGIPVVRELTGDDPLPGERGPLERVLRLGFTRARLLIALSDSIERRYLEAGIPPSRIWARPNPVDTEVFRPPEAAERLAARERFGLREADCVHLVLARFRPLKNQLFAVAALAHLEPTHKLMLLGPVLDGDEPYLAEVRERIGALGLGCRVIVVPHYVDDTVAAYHAADVYWLPSRHEGLPNVMLEALCCGLPVVANDGLGMQAHVIDGVNGFNVPLEPGAFASAAKKAATSLDNPGALSSRVAAAHELYDARGLSIAFAKRLAAVLSTDNGAVAS